MKRTHARAAAVLGVTLLIAALLAACGGGSSPSNSSAATTHTSTTTTTTGGATGGTGASGRSASLANCLKRYGITVPSDAFPGRRFGGTARSGATDASVPRRAFGFGATGATGRGGFLGRAGGLPGGNSKLADALRRCLGAAGFPGRRGLGARRGFSATSPADRTEVANYSRCMNAHGEKLPKPNFSGSGSVFGSSVNQTSTAFQTANAKCRSILTFLTPRQSSGSTG
jgi:hypothetical protein